MKKYQPKVPLHVTIDADQYHYIGQLADQKRSSVSQVIRELLNEGIRKERENNVRKH